MCQNIQAMSDADLLGLMVGTKTAQRILKDADGSLAAILNESVAQYRVEPKVNTKLQAAKELVRRSLLESMRHRDVLSSPMLVRDTCA